MLVTYTTDNENFSQVDVNPDLEFGNFIALITIDSPHLQDRSRIRLVVVVNGQNVPVDGSTADKKISEIGIGDNDIVALVAVPLQAAGPTASRPQTASVQSNRAETGRKTRISNLIRGIQIPPAGAHAAAPSGAQRPADNFDRIFSPENLRRQSRHLFVQMTDKSTAVRVRDQWPTAVQVYQQNPNDYDAFHKAFVNDNQDFVRRYRLAHDPTSIEGQRLIAELIEREKHAQSYKRALEEMPEAFVRSHMLYVIIKINGHETMAFIDTGAQITSISSAGAAKMGLTDRIDKAFASVISGVGGQQSSDGRIHSIEIELNGHVFHTPLTVLPTLGEDVLIGLDTLRRHGAQVDLAKNCLRLGEVEVPFLDEHTYVQECRRLGLTEKIPPDTDNPLRDDEIDAEKVVQLVAMGFDTERVRNALAKAHNNIAFACSLLDQDTSTGPTSSGTTGGPEPME